MALWLAHHPLILASKSAARRAVLTGAGVQIEVHPASVDERSIEAQAGPLSASEIAGLLAREKARAVAAQHPRRLVLGADQTLALDKRVFSKASSRAEAREQLQALRGRKHSLHSAFAIICDDNVMFEHNDAAHLTMRTFTDQFLEDYLDTIGRAATASVGGYQLEGVGVQLFERVEGDHFTVLGMPLLPLLDWLRQAGFLAK
jgi:septum formation protein